MHVPHEKTTNYYQFSGEDAARNIHHPQEEIVSSKLDICILLVGQIP